MWEKVDAEMKTFLIKIILPAAVAVSMGIAIRSRKEKVSAFNIIASFIIGIGGAYLTGDIVLSAFAHEYVPLVIGIIALVGEKFAYFFLFTLKVDRLAVSFLEWILGLIKLK